MCEYNQTAVARKSSSLWASLIEGMGMHLLFFCDVKCFHNLTVGPVCVDAAPQCLQSTGCICTCHSAWIDDAHLYPSLVRSCARTGACWGIDQSGPHTPSHMIRVGNRPPPAVTELRRTHCDPPGTRCAYGSPCSLFFSIAGQTRERLFAAENTVVTPYLPATLLNPWDRWCT